MPLRETGQALFRYGLILPEKTKKSTPVFQASRNVFGHDSDSDNENKKKKLGSLRPSDNIKRQAKVTQEKALMEDPTVYQYDEIYDEMTTKKKEEKNITKEDKKPRYIEKLMKSAQKRKIENERRLERQAPVFLFFLYARRALVFNDRRQVEYCHSMIHHNRQPPRVQKEREKEGDEFADKEVFVTSAYKKKLEEMQKEEEKEKYEEYLENIGDVTKQKDLGGFYRHLYEQKLGPKNESTSDISKIQDKTETVDVPKTPEKTENTETRAKRSNDKSVDKKPRNYRKRKSSNANKDLSEGEFVSDDEINRVNLEDIKAAKKPRGAKDENIDADSDFSIDESSDEKSTDEPHTPKIEDRTAKAQPTELKQITKEAEENIEKQNLNEQIKSEPTPKKEEPVVEVKPKIDIWKKRTVGEVFEQAQKRYYERKAARYRNM
ncbi:Nuclear speckle splicing regulatory protein 1 [Eumeta japonica]|uniref:Nuclear speckle splicing regulatory protein 1 n=1 Tax=Eumeta variegata TaxID=151549 RepID=A0A4C1TEP9_EUMVA|nr:Nuclear speckle splicing regulatory protein 1 [Eumeta japonica]